MQPEPVIAIAATPRDWAQRLHRHLADHGGGRIRATVLSARETTDERYDVLVVDDTTSFLSARLVERLHQDGRAILGLYDPQDPHGKSALVEAGVDEALPCDLEAAELAAALRQLTADRPGTAQTTSPLPPIAGESRPSAPLGRLLRVVGSGGCGTTEIAVALAASLTARGRVVLLETDERRASLAPRLGLPPYPNLHSALDQSRRGAGLALAALQPVSDGLAVLVAGPPARRGALLPPDDLGMVVDDLRRHADWVVLDGGADDRGVVVGDAAQIVVGAESPIGVMRLCALLRDRAAESPHVVLNRCSSSTFRRYEIATEISRAAVPASLVTVPDDPRVSEAGWRGQTVRRGPFTRAADRVAAILAASAAEPAR
jgi:MinD-like ATPase involved in chromosome partitioning or flagellar assembly